MSTTGLIVEIVVIGVLTILALFANLKCFCNPAADHIYNLAIATPNFAVALAVVLPVAYALGWAVNSLAYVFTAAVFRAEEDLKIRRWKKGAVFRAREWMAVLRVARIAHRAEKDPQLRRFKKRRQRVRARLGDFLRPLKVFCVELWTRLAGSSPESMPGTLGNLGNYGVRHALVMQRASDYSTRFLADHFSMLRIDRASFFILVLLYPAACANPYRRVTAVLDLVFILLLYFITKKAYTFYKKLRDSVGEAVAEQRWVEEHRA